MRRWGPLLAIAWVMVVGAITLLGVARNRAGEPDGDVVLTERELPLPPSPPEENTGLSLRFERLGTRSVAGPDEDWLDRSKLESLGFDCRFPVESATAQEHYSRMPPREAVLVLEYDGEAARRWIAEREGEARESLRKAAEETNPEARARRESSARESLERARTSGSRLAVVDAGLDAGELRRRYPDRSTYVLARGIVRIVADPLRLHGRVGGLLVEAIHVPRDQRSLLDGLLESDRKPREGGNPGSAGASPRFRPDGTPHAPRYRVHVRWGRRLEPWIVAVEPL